MNYRLLVCLWLTSPAPAIGATNSATVPVDFATKNTDDTPAFVSDDGSQIRPMPGIGDVETVHCRLAKGRAIQASRHKTVSQIWYVISGKGEMWLSSSAGKASVIPLAPGKAITVPLGFAFQFRNLGNTDLDIFIVNTTKWSGPGELLPVDNHWPMTPH